MKFTIDVEDFWLEEEELTEALQGHIKHNVVREISESIKVQVEKKISEKVKETIDAKIELVIDTVLTDLVSTGVIVSNNSEIAISTHVKNLFQKNHGWNNPAAQMEQIAKKFGEDLKLQYNNVFANKIVQNMKKQGLLKDEVVQILLEGS